MDGIDPAQQDQQTENAKFTAEHWKLIEQIFNSVIELPSDQRAAYLDEACKGNPAVRQKIEALVAAHFNSSVKLGPAVASVSHEDLTTADPQHERKPVETLRIGPYQVVRRIGEGGMGSVFLAMRDDQQFKKYVAIKIIRKGMDSDEIIDRFRRERQILAALDHPNIAKLFDGGSTQDGLPYFVMEHISGSPLNEYCDTHRLSIKERLQLFRSICSAVQYAHQNLVIHRDLKPLNILVTADGIPKLLDFGIAKVLNADHFSLEAPMTVTGMRVMTPAYASPEQVKGDPLGTTSDVYALGVILYELLTGARPYEFSSLVDFYRIICEQEPARPSAAVLSSHGSEAEQISTLRGTTQQKMSRQLRGDLDNITLMALNKEPRKRYPSAQALSDDIGRYLEGRAVSARKPTWSYRTGKYVNRHITGVAAATVVLLLLIAFAVTTSVQNAKIRRERDTAEQVTKLLANLFQNNDPVQTKGEAITTREILDRGAAQVHNELKDQPEVKAELLNIIGNIYEKLGAFDDAKPLLEESLQIRRTLYGDEDLKVADCLNGLGVLLRDTGKYPEAEKTLRKALYIRRRLLGNEHPDVATTLSDLAEVQWYEGQRTGEIERNLREALAVRQKTLGKEHTDIASSLNDLALVLDSQGRTGEAEKLYREALAMRRKLSGDTHPGVAVDMVNLANLLAYTGRMNEAEKLLREALRLNLRLYGSGHPVVSNAMHWLAVDLRYEGKLDEAEELSRQAVDIDRKLPRSHHPEMAKHLAGLSETLLAQGSVAEASGVAREALTFSLQMLPEDNVYRAEARSALGACLMMEKKYSEVEPLLLEAYPVIALHDKGTPYIKIAYQRILDLYTAWGHPEKAEEFKRTHPIP